MSLFPIFSLSKGVSETGVAEKCRRYPRRRKEALKLLIFMQSDFIILYGQFFASGFWYILQRGIDGGTACEVINCLLISQDWLAVVRVYPWNRVHDRH